ncbi:insoluble matrix shell protein [Acrasis kona]|uniref:Insoluble matrix shell protein n=1 Tax=Acrasis kona TaxID=1008807 RepID=A0AAW2YKR3_9EUKA
MMHKVLFFVLVIVALCSALEERTLVVMHIFSSDKNPQWYLEGADRTNLLELVAPLYQNKENECYPNLHNLNLGYSGFSIVDSADKKCLHVHNSKEAEDFLLQIYIKNSIAENASSKKLTAIIDHASEVIRDGLRIERKNEMYANGFNLEPIRGPDNWNQSPWQYQNNCYNYGNDVRTDTFAQPGRGTQHKWEENTCTSVFDAAVRDGLLPYSDKLPEWEEKPKVGHFIALVIWPDVNFHWYKKDIDGYWSHKPGGTAARNVDNSDERIKDPSRADRGPYTIFCTYLVSVPSKVQIN